MTIWARFCMTLQGVQIDKLLYGIVIPLASVLRPVNRLFGYVEQLMAFERMIFMEFKGSGLIAISGTIYKVCHIIHMQII